MNLSNKNMSKIIKSTLAVVLAGGFTLSSSIAHAAGETEKNQNLPVVELSNSSTSTENNTNTQLPQQDTNESTEISTNAPSVLPGDFFYFVKLTFEKIKLALTFDKKDEAKLLATYATERIAEADALLAEGNEEKAIEVIQQATEYMKNAENMADEKAEENESAEFNPNEDQNENEQQSGQQNEQQNQTDEQVTEDKKDEAEGNVEVEKVLSQNIISLTAALNKVQNPKAKAALQRNIERAYAKLAEKIEKQVDKEKKVASSEVKGTVTDDATNNENKTDLSTEEKDHLEHSTTSTETSQSNKVDKKDHVKKHKKVKHEKKRKHVKENKKHVKKHKKEAHKHEVEKRHQEKAELKEIKQQWKQKKEEYKKERKDHHAQMKSMKKDEKSKSHQ